MKSTRRFKSQLAALFGTVVLLGAALGIAACGGSDGAGTAAAGDSTKSASERSSIDIAMVVAATPGDPFWNVVKNGADTAAEELGVNITWKDLQTFDIAEYAQNIEAALATQPDGLAVTFTDEDAVGPLVERATNEGIPVVSFNEGPEESLEYGAIVGVASEEFEAGRQAGERMSEAGATHVLCVNPAPGAIALEHRCEGFEEGFDGKAEQLATDVADPTATQNRIEAAVREDSSVDGIIPLWAEGSDLALAALEKAGKTEDVQVATFDLNPTALANVRDGKLLFAIDQQPYLQGYLPVLFLTQYIEIGTSPVGVVGTGPLFVTKDNAEQVIELSREGLR